MKEITTKNVDAVSRFWKKVNKTESCWLWTGCRDTKGYGTFRLNGKMVGVHRISYEWHKEKIPEGFVIDHLCRERKCCNPAHLEAVTPATNTLRGISFSAVNSKKTVCINGHELSGINIINRKGGNRECRSCARERSRSRRLNKNLDM